MWDVGLTSMIKLCMSGGEELLANDPAAECLYSNDSAGALWGEDIWWEAHEPLIRLSL